MIKSLASEGQPANGVLTVRPGAPVGLDSPELQITVIRPPRGWQLINFRELWRFRELVYFLTWRDVKVRYKQTLLGAAWAILQPAMMMVIFTIFFARMAGVPSGDIPYPLFAYAGLLPWTFFASAISNAGNSVVGSERLVTKIYFPRLAFPFASVGAAVVDFAMALVLLVGMMIYYGFMPGLGLLLALLLFTSTLLAALGMGALLAALNVAYRDFRYVIPFMVQMWMFATPTIYMDPTGSKASRFQAVLALNPMTGLIASFRAAALDQPIPWSQFGLSTACAVLMFLIGCLYFRKVEDNFADII
jgi:lipopolysaccharide transport system permease protein